MTPWMRPISRSLILSRTEYIKSQRICQIRYNNHSLSVQTPYINQERHSGIPGISKFYSDDRSRAFYKLIFYNSDDKFKQLLMQIDDIASNLNNKIFREEREIPIHPDGQMHR
jgi:hypothetical protein